MNIYEIHPVLDNPLFEGLALTDNREVLNTWPDDWRAKYQSWRPILRAQTWTTPKVIGNVRRFNDYPCINLSRPAFSARALDLLHDMLTPNGELLPVSHKIGTYYFYNCTRMLNCIDLARSKTSRVGGGVVSDTQQLVFLDDVLQGETIFKARTLLLEIFCTQTFVDRVEAAGLDGFMFVPIWPLPPGVTFYDELNRMNATTEKRRPKADKFSAPMGDLNENTVAIRLYCSKKKPSRDEKAAAEAIVMLLNDILYDKDQASLADYHGSVEGSDVVDGEIRVFISAPDAGRLVTFLLPHLRKLPWPGQYHVVKRRGKLHDTDAAEEYVSLT